MTEIARDPGGYVLPVCDQPWFDSGRTPPELIKAWEQANREDWVRFDAWLRKEREVEAKERAAAAAKARTFFFIVWVLVCIWAVAR